VLGVADERPPLVIVTLRTERLELTPLDPVADAPSLHAMFADPLVYRYDTDACASSTVAQTEHRLRRQLAANGATTWAVRQDDGPAVGTIGIFADQGTTIRGVGWSLSRQYWGRGIMSEAARTAIPYLLAQDGVDGLEAWVDSRNVASIGVARAGGMAERARLPRVYDDHVAQTVVMARAASIEDPEVFAVHAKLEVRDLAETLRVLRAVLRLHEAWAVPDPPVLAFLAVEPWSGAPGLRVAQVAGEPIVPRELVFEVGVSVDVVRERVEAAGLRIIEVPTDRPWSRRELRFALPEGHTIVVSGPSSPPCPA
jgi:RimJ/RimL family protein N-acetyltransferase/catechol 2,3-dioxygenase-like lactoylglutathione lyase family enzyme